MKRMHVLLSILLLLLLHPAACSAPSESDFGIFLLESGEPVITEEHVKVYHRDTHTIELNEAGIEKWNSFIDYPDIPKLKDTLYQQVFAVRIGDEEIYRGKLYSMVSSMSYDGVVILDALMKLDEEKNTIRIDFGFPGPVFGSGEDPRNAPEVLGFFESRGLLD